MALIIGVVLALAVGVFATRIRLDRDRAFYPTIMLVIALLYVLFAAMGGSRRALLLDLLVGSVFIVAAVVGFKRSLWIVVAALAGHGLMDLVHGRFIDNPGVPVWWPGFCSAYDVCAAAYLAWLLKSGRVRVQGVA
jgi:vacuolar-type H+-ATPase subunit I/STV1